MHILRLLHPLEKLESRLAFLYERFSEAFRFDPEVSAFFFEMSIEESAHADLVRFQRRLVSADADEFGDIDVDTGEINRILGEVEQLIARAGAMSVEEALDAANRIESGVAEQHYLAVILKANPAVTNLFRNLYGFDRRHAVACSEQIRKRCRQNPDQRAEISGAEAPEASISDEPEEAARQRLRDIPREFVDRIEHLYTWHRADGYYKVLGVRPYAGDAEIKSAYRRMAGEFHPDLHADFPDGLKMKLTVILGYLNDAYRTLSDPARRSAYDNAVRSVTRK